MFSVNTVIGQPGNFEKDRVDGALEFKWPQDSLQYIPDWVYTSPEIYHREMKRIFKGPAWSFVALEAEIPNAGDYKRSYVGDIPVVVSRDTDGSIHVFENRCAHRGAEFCRAQRGNAKEFVCPYHQWSYDLRGNLQGIPFKRGLKKEGGMPKDFRNEDHGLAKLRVGILHGVVFATFSEETEELADYLSPEILKDFEVVFKGRKVKLLGYYRNELPGNWKLYHENLKDPYHATLLHSFLVTFGLMVAGSRNAMIADPSGRHGTLASAKPDDVAAAVDEATKKEMRAYREDFKLADGRFLHYVREFDSPWSVTMQTIWPNLIVQRELNTLGIRHIVPNGPHSMIMLWTMFGYETDDEEMTRHRLRQGNLMGPSGFLGLEDNEAIKFVQEGVRRSPSERGVVKLGGDRTGSASLIDESAIRGMYGYYRKAMGL
jgi:anthranilate 1,2-dioxygenase large subunit